MGLDRREGFGGGVFFFFFFFFLRGVDLKLLDCVQFLFGVKMK